MVPSMKITCDHDAWTITLSQTVYINTIAHRFNLKTSHPVYTPLDSSIVLSKDLNPKK